MFKSILKKDKEDVEDDSIGLQRLEDARKQANIISMKSPPQSSEWVRGLINPANICYMNSVLQVCLYPCLSMECMIR